MEEGRTEGRAEMKVGATRFIPDTKPKERGPEQFGQNFYGFHERRTGDSHDRAGGAEIPTIQLP